MRRATHRAQAQAPAAGPSGRRRLLVLGAAAALAGCATRRQVRRYHVLEVPPAAAPAAARTRPGTLLVTPMSGVGFYDTQDIAFSPAPGTRAYYQFANWAIRPTRRIAELMAQRLTDAKAFTAVASATSGVNGEWLLNTHLEELYHDAAQAPGVARLRVSAELVDPLSRKLLARRTFVQAAPVGSFDAAGAVQAMAQAVQAWLDELVVWVDRVVPA